MNASGMNEARNAWASATPTRGAGRLVLGIETSCDETAAAVVRDGYTVLSNVIASQNELHAEYRGVVPEIASRAHAERIVGVVEASLEQAGATLLEVDAIAVGNRPGLIGPLLVGVAAGKALAMGLGKPVIGVDHVRAHLIAGMLSREGEPRRETAFPALGLVVSGGHTSLYWCEGPTRSTKLGGTIDDALGEAYDKVAAILGLAFPGGPSVDRLAKEHEHLALAPDREGFPISRLSPESLDFSFSGLKTAALYAYRGNPTTASVQAKRALRREPAAPTMPREQVAATFQRAAVETIVLKIERALDGHPSCRTMLVGGGVSANSELRRRLAILADERRIDLRLPAMELCLDNAAMIAALGFLELESRGWKSDAWSMSANPTTGS